jgi:predicted nuclease of predicted toxin-antitoxin system
MTFVADENFPQPALDALRKAGCEVFSVAEEYPGISDEEVAALCSESQRVLLTYDKDFGDLVFRRGLSAGSGSSCSGSFPNLPRKPQTSPWQS